VFRNRAARWSEWQEKSIHSPTMGEGQGGGERPIAWINNWWFATREELAANEYNLSAGRYRPITHLQTEHREPLEILAKLRAMEDEIVREMEALETRLKETVL